jgi:hypothetical protein
MVRAIFTLSAALAAAAMGLAQATVHVEPYHLNGPRELQEQTASAVVRDYIESWQSMRTALGQNSASALDRDFVGDAKDKLAKTVQEQVKQGLRTEYIDRAHDIQIVFYSPEGLSVELSDKADYDVQVFDHDKLQTTQHVSARYIVVLTPTEVRWRVRVFQAVPE